MNKNVIMVKISGGVLLKTDFHPPPAYCKDVLKPLCKQEGE